MSLLAHFGIIGLGKLGGNLARQALGGHPIGDDPAVRRDPRSDRVGGFSVDDKP
jgi:hypothetical protein